MKVVMDTSAIIYIQDFRKFEEIFTTSSVLEEVKDRRSEMKLSGLSLKVLEPSKDSLKEVEEEARKTGDLEKLSNTDLEILALAKELNVMILSDDYNVQNVAKKLGIEFVSISTKGIEKLYFWKKFCPSCKKFFSKKEKECPVCGSKLRRMPKIKRKA